MMQRIAVEQRDNNFQHIDVLKRNRQKRRQYGEFFVEGVRQLNAALAGKWKFAALYCAKGRELSKWAADFVRESGAPILYQLNAELMAELSGKEDTSELIAAVKMPDDSLKRIERGPDSRIVIFDRPASPGNLGSAIRSCNAFGADAIIVTGHAVDIYDPRVLQSSVGAFFSHPIVCIDSAEEVLSWLRSVEGFQVVGTSAKAGHALHEFHFAAPLAIVFGNEKLGMSRYLHEACDTNIRIPMGGEVTSLNLSSAVSVVLYEVQRQQFE